MVWVAFQIPSSVLCLLPCAAFHMTPQCLQVVPLFHVKVFHPIFPVISSQATGAEFGMEDSSCYVLLFQDRIRQWETGSMIPLLPVSGQKYRLFSIQGPSSVWYAEYPENPKLADHLYLRQALHEPIACCRIWPSFTPSFFSPFPVTMTPEHLTIFH